MFIATTKKIDVWKLAEEITAISPGITARVIGNHPGSNKLKVIKIANPERLCLDELRRVLDKHNIENHELKATLQEETQMAEETNEKHVQATLDGLNTLLLQFLSTATATKEAQKKSEEKIAKLELLILDLHKKMTGETVDLEKVASTKPDQTKAGGIVSDVAKLTTTLAKIEAHLRAAKQYQ